MPCVGKACACVCIYMCVLGLWLYPRDTKLTMRNGENLTDKFALKYLKAKFMSLVKMMLISQISLFVLSDQLAYWDY